MVQQRHLCRPHMLPAIAAAAYVNCHCIRGQAPLLAPPLLLPLFSLCPLLLRCLLDAVKVLLTASPEQDLQHVAGSRGGGRL
jgi:hypothetical protein